MQKVGRLAFCVVYVGAGIASPLGASQRPPGRTATQEECSTDLLKDKSFDALPRNTTAQATRALAVRALETNRIRWGANRVPYYRLCVATFNPLRISLTQSDVRDRVVVTANQAAGRGLGMRPRSGEWAPSEGHTVESLFEEIERLLRSPGIEFPGRTIPFEVNTWYDPRKGYPIRIDYGLGQGASDGDVSIHVTLTESPTVPLVPSSSGEAYATPKRARIVRTDVVYDALFLADRGATNVRRVWPTRADEIVARGYSVYWRDVGWEPRPGMTGNVIGTFKHPDGQSLYLLEFRHQNSTLFYPTATRGVELID